MSHIDGLLEQGIIDESEHTQAFEEITLAKGVLLESEQKILAALPDDDRKKAYLLQPEKPEMNSTLLDDSDEAVVGDAVSAVTGDTIRNIHKLTEQIKGNTDHATDEYKELREQFARQNLMLRMLKKIDPETTDIDGWIDARKHAVRQKSNNPDKTEYIAQNAALNNLRPLLTGAIVKAKNEVERARREYADKLDRYYRQAYLSPSDDGMDYVVGARIATPKESEEVHI